MPIYFEDIFGSQGDQGDGNLSRPWLLMKMDPKVDIGKMEALPKLLAQCAGVIKGDVFFLKPEIGVTTSGCLNEFSKFVENFPEKIKFPTDPETPVVWLRLIDPKLSHVIRAQALFWEGSPTMSIPAAELSSEIAEKVREAY